MSDKSEASAAIIGGVVVVGGVAALMAVAVIWGGFVFQQLWNWYAPPFTAIRLSLAEAVGVCALINVVRGTRRSKKEADSDGASDLLFAVAVSGIALLIGWAAHFFL